MFLRLDLGQVFPGADNLTAQFDVHNLFDESYIGSVAGGWGGWIGAPRTVTGTVSMTF